MIYVRDGELRVVNDAKGQDGYRTYEPDGHIREPLHRLAPFARREMFFDGRPRRQRPADADRRSKIAVAKYIRKIVGRGSWHRWNVLKKRVPETVAREQARFFIHRAQFARQLAARTRRAADKEGED